MGYNEKLFNEKMNRVKTTTNHMEADRVPVMGLYQTWPLGHYDVNYNDLANDFELEKKVYSDICKEFDFDCTWTTCNEMDITINKPLCIGDESAYFLNGDGQSYQHVEKNFLKPEGYDQLLQNKNSYEDELILSKYPIFSNDIEAVVHEKVTESFMRFMQFMQKMMRVPEISREANTPVLMSQKLVMPLDMILSLYSGTKGLLTDIRRRPGKVIELADMIFENSVRPMVESVQGDFPYLSAPLLVPTFLSPKQFEKVYWPTFKRTHDLIVSKGGKLMLIMEGKWEHLYDYINEFDKSKVICSMENDDIVKAKKMIGDTVTLAGGIDIEALCSESKEENINRVKRVIDECAPGGGFMLAPNRILLNKQDVNPENYKAVIKFAQEYGRY